MELDLDKSEMLLKSMTMIQSQDMLKDMALADYPNMKQEERSRMHRRISSMAYREEDIQVKTTEEAFNMFKGY